MNRGQLIARRLAQMVPVLVGVTLVAFALLQLIPGDPAVSILGIPATEESVAALRHQLGLDQPLWRQYLGYLHDVVTLNLGTSIKFKTSVE